MLGGCCNCLIVIVLLVLYFMKKLNGIGTALTLFAIWFFLMFCILAILGFCAIKKDTEELEMRRKEI
jgi:hypothetical protein